MVATTKIHNNQYLKLVYAPPQVRAPARSATMALEPGRETEERNGG